MALQTATGARSREELYAGWQHVLAERPHVRARDAALALGVSEAQLAAVRCAHGEGRALVATPAPLLAGIPPLGTVVAVTRSSAAILENVGAYGPPDIGEHTGIVIGENIDLRIFPSGWKFAYALHETTADGPRRSLQIFDARGKASHTIYLRPDSTVEAYDELVDALALDASAEPIGDTRTRTTSETADRDIDIDAYRAAFAAMQDTHDFFMLLHRFGLTREQGLRLAGDAYARRLTGDAHRELFARAANERIPLMIFVANGGMVQISSGAIPAPTFAGSWCNLVTPRSTLHLDEDGIARAWAVRKPTIAGSVTSLELFDSGGDLVVQVFGERHAGEGERADWAAAIAALGGGG